ncbi:flagellar basal body protein, partial [bacterium]|nr:flagellar basal body protein [bacterium]
MSYLGIETARKSLLAHQAALQTVSHNMSNANTEGYSRQEVVFSTASPLYPSGFDIGKEGAGQIGTGVTISEI